MKQIKIRGTDIKRLGIVDNRFKGLAINVLKKHFKHESREWQLKLLSDLYENPENFREDDRLEPLVNLLTKEKETIRTKAKLSEGKPFTIFGEELIEESAKHQMYMAMKLPVAEEGALMPDSHHGYGLPIGGVLATNNAIIPHAVGMDIGCRMSLSIFHDTPELLQRREELNRILKENTRFGGKELFANPTDVALLENQLFNEIPVLRKLQYKARLQLGTSGGGNHFVEFGMVTITKESANLGIPEGRYFGLLSHSGSRSLGAGVARYYTEIARGQLDLPKGMRDMSWLDMDSEAGQEYWLAMNLAGEYASACHHDIHERMIRTLGLQRMATIENHHNFAWKETLSNGKEVIVHRKGATPAGKDVLGIIPGSMTSPAFIVEGLGNQESLNSASHGAGRQMSRGAAKAGIGQDALRKVLKDKGVELIGGGVDEAPMAYKDINDVMQRQQDLVETLGRFTPKFVRMAKE